MLTITPYQNTALSRNLLPKVIKQLNRDLELTGFDFSFNVNLSLDDWAEETVRFFEKLLNSNDNRLYNLLYRIDVNQNKIFSGNGSPQYLLAQLVIQREFEKVVLREMFGTKRDS